MIPAIGPVLGVAPAAASSQGAGGAFAALLGALMPEEPATAASEGGAPAPAAPLDLTVAPDLPLDLPAADAISEAHPSDLSAADAILREGSPDLAAGVALLDTDFARDPEAPRPLPRPLRRAPVAQAAPAPLAGVLILPLAEPPVSTPNLKEYSSDLEFSGVASTTSEGGTPLPLAEVTPEPLALSTERATGSPVAPERARPPLTPSLREVEGAALGGELAERQRADAAELLGELEAAPPQEPPAPRGDPAPANRDEISEVPSEFGNTADEVVPPVAKKSAAHFRGEGGSSGHDLHGNREEAPAGEELSDPLEAGDPLEGMVIPVPEARSVQVEVDRDLSLEIELEAGEIGIVAEGSAEALYSLEGVGEALAADLENSGYNLRHFDRREREGRDPRSPRFPQPDGEGGPAVSDTKPQTKSFARGAILNRTL